LSAENKFKRRQIKTRTVNNKKFGWRIGLPTNWTCSLIKSELTHGVLRE
jgi:hypothetical protein